MARRSSAEVESAGAAPPLPVQVEVQIAEAFAGLVREERLQAWAEAALRHEGVSGEATVVITDDPGIQELNRGFLGIDAPTDVLAFSAQEEVGDFVTAPETVEYLGDVIVSYPQAEAQAGEAGHAVEQELLLLIVHGLLHLLGADHAEEEDKAAMWARQEEILREVALL